MTRSITALIAVLTIAFTASANAADKLERRIAAATEVLEQFTRIPEQGIPPNLLRNAHGGPFVVAVNNARICLGRGMAMKIEVD